jgi:asparagine synthase (glutamine-hydrolysing)
MCGIFGTTIDYQKKHLEQKLARAAFRGPDRQKMISIERQGQNRLTFGHNRLSIIDLDPRSDQPFNYEHLTIVFNGEIYNFKELRESLKKVGHTFKTTSDTEVLCAAYLEYGEECPSRLNGMFAFVIYDRSNDILFGARDRLGQKPFYYYHKATDFEFASQIAQIQLHNRPFKVSNKAILEYLKWGAVPDALSIYEEVKKLKPGHSFTFGLKSGKFKERRYWDIPKTNSSPFTGTYEEAQENLEALLKDAVDLRMYADVPVGVFLSGGIDSSLVAALSSTSAQKVRTFSVKFTEDGFDESEYAKKVADHLKTDHHIIECNPNEGLNLIENFNFYYDEPFADSSAIPSMLLAKHTRDHVTVALSGDGGDESFIGYQRYAWTKKVSPIYQLPKFLRVPVGKILSFLPNDTAKAVSKGISKENIEELYTSTLSNIDLSWIDYNWGYKDVIEEEYLFHKNKNLMERISDFDLKAYLNWDINTKVDRATMAVSLEARSPLMDYRVVDFARSLPTHFKFYKGNQKRILKDILYKYVPEAYFDRPKAGFTMPFEAWFRKDLKEMVLTELSTSALRDIPGIHPEIVRHKIEQHMSGNWDRSPIIWKLLVLKKWLNESKANH